MAAPEFIVKIKNRFLKHYSVLLNLLYQISLYFSAEFYWGEIRTHILEVAVGICSSK